MLIVNVSPTTRKIEIELTPEEAEKIQYWAQDLQGVIPYEVRQYLAPALAVAQRREFGGS